MPNTPNSPFLRVASEASANRKAEYIVDVDAFGRALQAALAKLGVACRFVAFEADVMPKWRSSILLEGNGDDRDGLNLLIETAYPSARHDGRVLVTAKVADVADRDKPTYGNGNEYTMPSARIATDRPLDQLAREIVRRVIDMSLLPARAIRAYAQTQQEHRAALDDRVADLEARFSDMLTIKKNEDGLGAQVEIKSRPKGDYFYLWGRLDYRGVFHVDRIQDMSPEFLADLFALARRHFPEPGQPKPVRGVDALVDKLRSYVSGDDVTLDDRTFLTYVSDRITDDLAARPDRITDDLAAR